MNSEVRSNYVLWDSLKLKCLGPNARQMYQTLHKSEAVLSWITLMPSFYRIFLYHKKAVPQTL